MDYDALKRRIRAGEVEVAPELLSEARQRGDNETILMCWSVVDPVRYHAWQALQAALKVAQLKRPHGDDAPPEGFSMTRLIRSEVVARALVDSSARLNKQADAIGVSLTRLAVGLLDQIKGGASSSAPLALEEAEKTLLQALACDSEASVLSILEDVSELLST